MKYKIVRYVHRTHEFNKQKGIYELIESYKYYAKRKGVIFGFWHDVGDFIWDSGGGHTMLNEFGSLEEAKSYVRCFHAENYENENYEIIKAFEL